jgi:hypothetical protein
MVHFLDIVSIAMYWLINFLVFILVIVTAVMTKKKDLEPNCKKGFAKYFIGFLIFLMFATFLDLAFYVTNTILNETYGPGYYFSSIYRIIWGINYVTVFLNQFFAYILLFGSMEIKLFNKKSKGKFGLLSIILLCGALLFMLVEIVMYYIFPFRIYEINIFYSIITFSPPYAITHMVVVILTNLNYLLIGILALVLLKKTKKKNELIGKYTTWLSAGLILLFIIIPIFNLIENILTFINYWFMINQISEENFTIITSLIIIGIIFLSMLIFLIGIILLSVGAIKTMSVPLSFSKEKGVKGTLRKKIGKTANFCQKCGTPVLTGTKFCKNCGKQI